VLFNLLTGKEKGIAQKEAMLFADKQKRNLLTSSLSCIYGVVFAEGPKNLSKEYFNKFECFRFYTSVNRPRVVPIIHQRKSDSTSI
jgi:hypothetical protein